MKYQIKYFLRVFKLCLLHGGRSFMGLRSMEFGFLTRPPLYRIFQRRFGQSVLKKNENLALTTEYRPDALSQCLLLQHAPPNYHRYIRPSTIQVLERGFLRGVKKLILRTGPPEQAPLLYRFFQSCLGKPINQIFLISPTVVSYQHLSTGLMPAIGIQ